MKTVAEVLKERDQLLARLAEIEIVSETAQQHQLIIDRLAEVNAAIKGLKIDQEDYQEAVSAVVKMIVRLASTLSPAPRRTATRSQRMTKVEVSEALEAIKTILKGKKIMTKQEIEGHLNTNGMDGSKTTMLLVKAKSLGLIVSADRGSYKLA